MIERTGFKSCCFDGNDKNFDPVDTSVVIDKIEVALLPFAHALPL